MGASGKTAQFSIGGDDPVTGDEQRHGIAPAGLSHGSCSPGFADGLSNLKIGHGLSERDLAKRVPDPVLEWGAGPDIQG